MDVDRTIERFEGPEVVLSDGQRLQPDVVLCATGYRRGLEPLVGHLGVLDDRGLPKERPEVEVDGAHNLLFAGYTPFRGLAQTGSASTRAVSAGSPRSASRTPDRRLPAAALGTGARPCSSSSPTAWAAWAPRCCRWRSRWCCSR